MAIFIRLSGGDAFDFYKGAFGERLDCDSAACRERGGEKLRVNLVHCGKITHVCQEYRCLDYVFQAKTGCGQDSFGICETLAGLFCHASLGECTCSGVNGELP